MITVKDFSLSALLDQLRRKRLTPRAHSGAVLAGDLFIVTPPAAPQGAPNTVGGEAYLADALARGASNVLCAPEHAGLVRELAAQSPATRDLRLTVDSDLRSALGRAAGAFYGTESKRPRIFGITGTNGKTTSAYLLESLFNSLGRKSGIIGTVSYRWPGHEEPAPLTTPGCLALHGLVAQMRDAGCEYVFMEVSSHALDQGRVAGLEFSGAMFSNLTQDHLDYHTDMENYFQAKARLFLAPAQHGVPRADKARAVNAEDPYGRRLLEQCAALPGLTLGFGLEAAPVSGTAHLSAKILANSTAGLQLHMAYQGQSWHLNSPLVGRFNAMNLLAAQALALGAGLPVESLKNLEAFQGVPGRLERIPNPNKLDIFVDYAHTPDALANALTALRDAGFQRVVTVFGCGGNRDRAKRPLMGQAVARHSDVAILTSDNPRHEDPLAIMRDVMPGLAACPRVESEPDRRKAIAMALDMLAPGDALLIAGKGHENYQQHGDVKKPFSDQAVVRELLQCA